MTDAYAFQMQSKCIPTWYVLTVPDAFKSVVLSRSIASLKLFALSLCITPSLWASCSVTRLNIRPCTRILCWLRPGINGLIGAFDYSVHLRLSAFEPSISMGLPYHEWP